MTNNHELETAKHRTAQVFRFLQEMYRVRTPPVVRMEDRAWRLRLEALPESEHVVRGYRFTEGGRLAAADAGYVFKVGRPRETECPEPSVVLKNWLKSGWDHVGTEHDALVKKTLTRAGKSQAFEDSEERVDAFDEWLGRRAEWEAGERDVVNALSVFSDLFELYARFERESEKYQLFLADGVLTLDKDGERISHPVLLQRVELSFEPRVPEFVLADSDDVPEIYTPLLRYAGLDGKAIQAACEAVANGHVHPLGTDSTNAFLKDFVQGNWKDGTFFESAGDLEPTGGVTLHRQPVVYLGRRNHGFAENVDRYIEALPGFQELPESLLRIAGIETDRRANRDPDEEAVDILLTKHANAEQERVIRQLEETGAVLVQGPPGTGKSHTIANLVGHLLAQEKSILVTSHTAKALRVVREKLAPKLQPLSVSVLESDAESAKQLEESVTGIVNYLASTSEKKLGREIEKLAERRTALKTKADDLKQRLLDAAKGEYEEIEVMGEKVSPSDAAREVVRGVGEHDWIPGPVPEGAELPLAREELDELYNLNAKIDPSEEPLLRSDLPDLAAFPTPQEFAGLFDELGALEKAKEKADHDLWRDIDAAPDAGADAAVDGAPIGHGRIAALDRLRESLEAAAESLANPEDWLLDAIEAGRTGGERAKAWSELVSLVRECAERIPDLEKPVLEHGPSVASDKSAAELLRVNDAILEHLESGKRLGKMTTLTRPEWKDFLGTARVEEGTPSKKAHFQAIRAHIEIQGMRERLAGRWDRQMAPLGAPGAAELGAAPERKAAEYARRIEGALAWHADVWAECERAIAAAGLDWPRFARRAKGKRAAHEEILRVPELVAEHLGPVLERRSRDLRKSGLATRKTDWIRHLDSFSRKDPAFPVIREFKAGIKKGNYDAYLDGWNRLQELVDSKSRFTRREELLAELGETAPGWAKSVRERRAPHHEARLPGDPALAWRHRQWEQCLSRHAEVDLDHLQEELQRAKEELFEATASYVEKRSWLAQLKRTGLEQQQALNGWLGLHKKIGKGTGKNVARWKEEAKRTLTKCRSAVPVWIMPLSRVVENFDLATTRFDVVILDEASQSDVMGLVAFALGREVVVVGDHEQVSPYAVGQKTERINALIDELLTEIPNRELYDGRTSVYDLARQSFGGTIRLLEHFRCVPEIIQFSNQLCYGGEIRALRDGSSSTIRQPLVAHRVANGQDRNGINENEALEIVSLVSAICRLDEYESSTIGVICMVGTDQALYIDSVLRQRLTAAEYKRRRVLCGNASQFQGDERDVIFLSMVNSPSGKPLTLRQREDAKKVFNVAASRARDQLWVVHSLDPGRDLKPGDLRLQLINHAERRPVKRPKKAKGRKTFQSDFEKQIFLELSRAGYRVIQQWPVGEAVIDLVVEGQGGRRVAIQCDGDRLQSVEAVVDALERQFTLERLGWDFVRLRASEYIREPKSAVKRLFDRLAEIEIRPAAPRDEESEGGTEDDLVKRVVKRAELIRQRWKGIPDAASVIEKCAVPAGMEGSSEAATGETSAAEATGSRVDSPGGPSPSASAEATPGEPGRVASLPREGQGEGHADRQPGDRAGRPGEGPGDEPAD